jgi:DNA-binding response OmpR family regulator
MPRRGFLRTEERAREGSHRRRELDINSPTLSDVTSSRSDADEPASGRILVVDDDPTVSDVVARYLRRGGYDVTLAADGLVALDLAAQLMPDLVVLDIMLPGLDGLAVCRTLRERSQVPVILLTALGAETDRIIGLEVGADDYVTKPFSPRELVLRVASVLRRSRTVPPPPASSATRLADGPLRVDLAAHEVEFGGEPLMLTVREFDLLAYLMGHARQTFSRDDLMRDVWGWSFGDQSTVTVHVRRLRQKLEAASDGTWSPIATVWGVGYRYDPSTVSAVG